VTVTGNLKYESPAPERRPGLEAAVARLAGERPVLLAGSTMAGEEEQVLAAFARLGGGERALLVLAPRHPERWDEVERLIASRGLAALRRSRIAVPQEGGGGPDAAGAGARPAVLLLDSLGELAGLYAVAAAAFVGGTLVPTGGHNPLEPARFGVPTAVGPSMDNFREMAEQFDRAGAWRRVAGPQELAAAWERWLADPEGARAEGARAALLVEANRGALGRTLALLAPLLAAVPGAGAAGVEPGSPGTAEAKGA
jgi:3-deoxy-D-manno-octulosonic-acid transferase